MFRIRLVAFVILTFACVPGSVLGQSVSAEISYKTKYLFAGIPFAADDVTQGQLTLAGGAFTVHGFTTYDHDAGEITEGDVWGDYYVQLNDMVGAFVGGALYNFKIEGEFSATPELYGGLVLAAPFNPTFYFARDFDLGDGNHFVLTLSESLPLTPGGAAFTLTGDVEYNDGYWREGSDFSFWDVIFALSLPVGPAMVTPMFQIQRAIADDFSDEEVFGVTAAFTP